MKLTKESFANAWTGLCMMYDKQATPELGKMYWNCLKNDLTDDELEACITLHVKNPVSGVYFPKPADILKHKKETYKTKAMEAWALITGDRYDKQKAKEDLIANKAMQMIGGWDNFSSVKTDDLPYRARDFCEAYIAVAEKNEREQVFDDTKALASIMKKLNDEKQVLTHQ